MPQHHHHDLLSSRAACRPSVLGSQYRYDCGKSGQRGQYSRKYGNDCSTNRSRDPPAASQRPQRQQTPIQPRVCKQGAAVSVADDGSGLLVLDHTKPQPHLPDRSLHRVRLSSVAASQGRRSSTRLTVTGIPARSGTPSQPNPPLHPVQSLDRSWTPGVHLRRLTSQLTNS